MSGQLPQFFWDLGLPVHIEQHSSSKCDGDLDRVMYLSRRKLWLRSHLLLGWSDLLQWHVYQHLQQLRQLRSVRHFRSQRLLLRQWQGYQLPRRRLRLGWHLPRLLKLPRIPRIIPKGPLRTALSFSKPFRYTPVSREH